MTNLIEKLENELNNFSHAERQIALFIINNREKMPFENATTLAKQLNLSAVTIGRFCRNLGYENFRDLKEELKVGANLPWLAGTQFKDFLQDFNENDTKNRQNRRKTLEAEIELLMAVYARSQEKTWQDAIDVISKSRKINIIGFQTERGLAAHLAYQLQYVRQGIELIDGASGNYIDILLEEVKDNCLIIIDIRRYSNQSKKLAKYAQKIGLEIVIITDTLCDWASEYTKHILRADCGGELFWHSAVPMAGLINLLINDIVGKSGGQNVEARLDTISQIYDDFTGFVRPKQNRNGQNND
jgi:DNA-binding MurR/RpiR family transcriptional regulator